MISTENIAKRIRLLRRQKGVSQEKMALDLGLYQADISNLERAMTGSGITDLFRLEMIAEYFGITLVELLAGSEPEEVQQTPEVKKPEAPALQEDILEDVRYGGTEDETFVSEATLKAPDGIVMHASFLERNGHPYLFKTDESVFEQLTALKEEDSLPTSLRTACVVKGGDYADLFENIPPEWLGLCRYLVFAATETERSDEDVIELIRETRGEPLKNIAFPVPEREPAECFEVNFQDLSAVYRYRLMIETTLKYPSVYDDMADPAELKRMKYLRDKLREACVPEEAYRVWKKDLIDAKVREVMEKQELVTIDYLFAGIGQYQAIIPKEMVDSFYCWIQGNGSAFAGNPEPATKKEIRTFVAQHIADELLGIDSPMV